MTAVATTRTLLVGAALNEALFVAMGLDPTVVCIGQDGSDPIVAGLSDKYGTHRVRVVPRSAGAPTIVDISFGAALAGYRPVAEVSRLDGRNEQAAEVRYRSGGQASASMVIRSPAGREASLAHIPGFKIVMPSTAGDAKGLLLSAIFDDDPVVVLEPTDLHWDRRFSGPVTGGDARVPIGAAKVKRAGTDLTLIAYGRPVHDCLAVAEELADQGMSVEVVDLRSLVPLDEATVLASVAKTKKAVVVHDAVQRAGYGAEVSSRIHEELFSDLERPVVRVGGAAAPMPYARTLRAAHRPGRDRIEAAVVSQLT